MYPLTSFTHFTHTTSPLSLATTNLFSVSVSLVFCLDSTCKLRHIVFDVSFLLSVLKNLYLLKTLQYFQIYFLLEDNCFIMLRWSLPYNTVNRPCAYACPSLLDLPPNPHPIPLDPHRASSWAPCAKSSIPLALYFPHASVYMSTLFSLFIPSSPPRLPPAATFPHVHSLHQCLYILFTIYILFATIYHQKHTDPHIYKRWLN